MNDERIKQVLNIEKEARQIHDSATHEAEQILLAAEQETGLIIENAKAETQKEARLLVADVQVKEDSERILVEAEENSTRAKSLSAGNFEQAVRFVLDRTTGEG